MSADRDRRICLFGAGGHGRVVGAIFKRLGYNEIIFGDQRCAVGTDIDGIPLEINDIKYATGYGLIITIGDNSIRRSLQLSAEKMGLNIIQLISSPESYFAADPGPGSMIMTAAVVNPGAQIGRGVIVNTGAIVEHDASIGDFCHLSPGSVVLGSVEIGDGVWLGANATVLPGVSICPDAKIGAGALVSKDIVEPGTYVGVPARRIMKSINYEL